jgi:RNA polymerase sigma factor (sigma-70 family)
VDREPPAELSTLCRLAHPMLVGTLSLYCGNRWIAEELTQETLTRACQSWHVLREHPAPNAWLVRVALNLARSNWRRRRAEDRALDRLACASSDDSDVARDVAVRLAVAGLPRQQRAVVVLRHYLQWPVQLVAQELGMSEEAVRTTAHRARLVLRARLADTVDDLVGEERS